MHRFIDSHICTCMYYYREEAELSTNDYICTTYILIQTDSNIHASTTMGNTHVHTNMHIYVCIHMLCANILYMHAMVLYNI